MNIYENESKIFNINQIPIKSDVEKICPSSKHTPPSHIVLKGGWHEYTCPACHETIRFYVNKIIC